MFSCCTPPQSTSQKSQFNLSVWSNQALDRIVAFQDKNLETGATTLKDLAGYTAKAQIDPGGGRLLVDITVIWLPPNPEKHLRLLLAQAAIAGIGVGSYSWDILLIDSAGTPRKRYGGTFRICQGVTNA